MNYNWFQLINEWAGRLDWFDDFMEFCAQDIVWVMIAVLAWLWLTGKPAKQKLVFFSWSDGLIVGLQLSGLENERPPRCPAHVLHPHLSQINGQTAIPAPGINEK